MPPPVTWRIFYADGTTLDNRECPEPRDLPAEKRVNAVGVVQRSERRNGEVLTGPWIYYMAGKWWCTDGNDNGAGIIMRWTFRAHEIEACLPGTWIDDDRFHDIRLAMNADPDFLPAGTEIMSGARK